MKKILKLAILLAFTTSFANAQQYNTAIGVKGGFPGFGTLSIKHFFASPSAFEINLGGGSHSLFVQALYERNSGISDGFDWYWGLGGHVGFWSRGYNYRYNDEYYTGSYGAVDGVLGLEYTFSEIPLNLAVDAGPSMRLFPYVGFGFGGAIALRFAIK